MLCHSYVPADLGSANEYGFSSKANDLLPSKQLTSVRADGGIFDPHQISTLPIFDPHVMIEDIKKY